MKNKKTKISALLIIIFCAGTLAVSTSIHDVYAFNLKKAIKKGTEKVKKGVKKAGKAIEKGGKKVYNKAKDIKEKAEVTAGWDRYIYAWGDREIPSTERWVAIRSVYKDGKGDMGNFWDVPGSGKAVVGAGKKLQLWEMPYKFQRYPKSDRRYKFYPLWERTKKGEDMGYYLIKSKTGYYVKNPMPDKPVYTYRYYLPGTKSFWVQSAQEYGKSSNGYWDIGGNPKKFKKGQKIQVWHMSSQDSRSPDRRFYFRHIEDDWHEIFTSLYGRHRVDVSGGHFRNGSKIQLWKKNSSAAQKFRMRYLGRGRWKIYTKNNYVVHLLGRSSKNGTAVALWKDHRGTWMEWVLVDRHTKKAYIPKKRKFRKQGYQLELNNSGSKYTDRSYHWKIINKGKNRFTFQSRLNKRYISVSGNAKKNGSNLTLSASSFGKSRWEFIIIANSNEKKSTGKMAKKRTREVSGGLKKEVNRLSKIVKKNGYKFRVGITEALGKKMDELTGLLEPKIDPRRAVYMEDDKKSSDIPSSIQRSASMKAFNWRDLGKMTSVKYQSPCGGCWAFASNGTYEGVYKILHNKEIDLSEQYIIDCAEPEYPTKHDAGSCNGGNAGSVFTFLQDHSNVTETMTPYKGKDDRCYAVRDDLPYKVTRWGYVAKGTPTVKQLKDALVKYGPLATSVYVTDLFKGYIGGVYEEKNIGVAPDKSNHAIVLVGWDDAKGAFLIKNSWSENWGEKGYMWIKYNSNNIGLSTRWIRIK